MSWSAYTSRIIDNANDHKSDVIEINGGWIKSIAGAGSEPSLG